jgi:DNA-binding transcriptional ArsR family regulator
MNTAPDPQLDRVFAALADPTRRAILARLASGEATVNELVAPFELAQPTISKHLKVLEGPGSSRAGATRSSARCASRRRRSRARRDGSAATAASGRRAWIGWMRT